MSKFIKLFLLSILLVACSPKDYTLSKLVVQTSNEDIVYYVETASTTAERSKGLMYRKELKPDSGMIFVLNDIKEIAMWMKNTYIPLDMLFTNTDGKIIWIYENAEPLSTTLIRPKTKEPVSAVVEINAGDVKKHNIKLGDYIIHKIFDKK